MKDNFFKSLLHSNLTKGSVLIFSWQCLFCLVGKAVSGLK